MPVFPKHKKRIITRYSYHLKSFCTENVSNLIEPVISIITGSTACFSFLPLLLLFSTGAAGLSPGHRRATSFNQDRIIVTTGSRRRLRCRLLRAFFVLQLFHEPFLNAGLLAIPPFSLFSHLGLVFFNALTENDVTVHLSSRLEDGLAPVRDIGISLKIMIISKASGMNTRETGDWQKANLLNDITDFSLHLLLCS